MLLRLRGVRERALRFCAALRNLSDNDVATRRVRWQECGAERCGARAEDGVLRWEETRVVWVGEV